MARDDDVLSVLLDDVKAAADQVGGAVDQLHAAVAEARTAGATWTEVATTLGISKQAAWERFAKRGRGGPGD